MPMSGYKHAYTIRSRPSLFFIVYLTSATLKAPSKSLKVINSCMNNKFSKLITSAARLINITEN